MTVAVLLLTQVMTLMVVLVVAMLQVLMVVVVGGGVGWTGAGDGILTGSCCGGEV